MPRFLFDIECSGLKAEHMSAELPDVEAARFYALGLIDIIMNGREAEPWRVAIKNDCHDTLKVLSSGADGSGEKSQ